MSYIVLSKEQASVVASATEPVQVRDSEGNVLTVMLPPVWTAEEIADAERRLASNEPCYTTAEVLAHLRALETHEPLHRFPVPDVE